MAEKARDLGDSERLTANEIFESAVEHARGEFHRPWTALSFSGIAGGLTMGLTGLSTGLVTWLGRCSWTHLIASAVYPIGFLAVIMGRAQLFTENTLYPVVLLLTGREVFVQNAETVGRRLCRKLGGFCGLCSFNCQDQRTESQRAGNPYRTWQ